jgi:hypothetical protein
MKTQFENPIEEVWRIRDELAAEEGNDLRTVFDILRREEKKYGNRVRSPRPSASEPALLREEPRRYGRRSKSKS